MSFDPRTIEHLGLKMYSQLPNALAELIANAYDACATKAIIRLSDTEESNRTITVVDNGFGMTYAEIDDKFLGIGRNRREEGEFELTCKRKATGKKGLGKLAFFGIGERITINTHKEGVQVSFVLDWNELRKTPSGEDYKPIYKINNCDPKIHGTEIILTQLKRKSGFDAVGLAGSLAKLFNYSDKKFTVELIYNEEPKIIIDNKLKYKEIEKEFEWAFPEFSQKIDDEYKFKSDIAGHIITTEKPLKPGFRGITLFANGRMVNQAEFFGSTESSHFFSYTTGWLDIDFVDMWEDDVISTNRQSLDWEDQRIIDLNKYLRAILRHIESDWREKRKEKRRENIKEKTKIDVPYWFSKLPKNILDKVEPLVNAFDDSELPEAKQADAVAAIHGLVPEYPYYHWRHLHPDIHSVADEYYNKREDYLNAAIEAVKKFKKNLQIKSGLSKGGSNLIETSFGSKNSVLLITKNCTQSERDLEDGHEALAKGVWLGFRNPVMHELMEDIFPSIFNAKDSLDVLSLVSYLLRKLDQTHQR